MFHYSLVKITNQMIFILLVKKDHPSHTRHIQIDLSKMKRGLFYPCTNLIFLPKFPVWKPKNSSSAYKLNDVEY
jgi:hypothetical protein